MNINSKGSNMWQLISLTISFAFTSILVAIICMIAQNKKINYKENQFFLYHEKIPIIGSISLLSSLFLLYFLYPYGYLDIENLIYLCILAGIGFYTDVNKKKIPFTFLIIINSFFVFIYYDFAKSLLYLTLIILLTTILIHSYNEIQKREGLAISLSIVILISYSLLYIQNDGVAESINTLALVGSLLAIKRHNNIPAKLLPGNSLSMIMGGLIIINFNNIMISSDNFSQSLVVNIFFTSLLLIYSLFNILKNIFNVDSNWDMIYGNGSGNNSNIKISDNTFVLLYFLLLVVSFLADNFVYALGASAVLILIYSFRLIFSYRIMNLRSLNTKQIISKRPKFVALEKTARNLKE